MKVEFRNVALVVIVVAIQVCFSKHIKQDAQTKIEAILKVLEEENELKELEGSLRNVIEARAQGDNGKNALNSKKQKDRVGRIQNPPEHAHIDHVSSFEGFIIESEEEYLENEQQFAFAKKHNKPKEKVQKQPLGVQMEEMIARSREKRSIEDNHRVKRYGIGPPTASNGPWPAGVVPYTFDLNVLDPSNPAQNDAVMARVRAMNLYSYYTCIRFYERNESTAAIFGFNNYLHHVMQSGCWSYVGRLVSLVPQSISTCGDYTAVHELGHALGQKHEQNNPQHRDILKVNFNSIVQGYQNQYFESDPALSTVYDYPADITTLMMYETWAFSLNYETTMDIYHPSDQYLLRQDQTGFLMFKEISEYTECAASHCPHLSECAVGGYVTQIRGICTCRCLPGLDGVTGCTTRYEKDRTSLQDWPTGPVTLLKTKKWGCPEHWEEGSVTMKVINPQHTFDDGADIDIGQDSVTLKFCTKPEPNNPGRIGEKDWPSGRHCIFQKGTCPQGYVDSALKFVSMDIPTTSESYPTGSYDTSDVILNTCCRNDGQYETPMHLPNKQPFILLDQGNYGCQSIVGMKRRKLFWSTDSPMSSMWIPKAKIANNNLQYCVYTPEDQDETAPASLWPSIPIKMPKPSDGCPLTFNDNVATYSGTAAIIEPTPTAIEWNRGGPDTTFEDNYCSKGVTSGSLGPMGQGQYCYEKIDGVGCHDEANLIGGFKEGALIIGQFNKKFCCRNDLFWKNPIKLPTVDSFVLYQQNNGGCQEVIDMSVHKETFTLSLPSSTPITKTGSFPYMTTRTVGSTKEYTIHLCHYTKYNQQFASCGGSILLDVNNPIVTIESPNYPNLYPSNVRCIWNIQSPEGTQIRLQFEELFGIEDNGICVSTIEIANRIVGQPGIGYCGDAYPQTEISYGNYTGIRFQSAQTPTPPLAVGFKATVTYIERDYLAYTGKGEDYRGTVNVTREYRPCLHWADPAISHCTNNMFNQQDLDDGLEKNYCRNPGHGTRPWCYAEADGCIREYCDVSNLDACHDSFLDCAERIQEFQDMQKDFCEDIDNEGPRGCAKTCQKCRKIPFSHVGSVTCNPPSSLPEAQLEVALKSSYSVGETISYQCTTSHEHTVSQCLPDGTWSGQGFVCSKCTTGWTSKDGYCYKWFNVYYDKPTVTELCHGFNGEVASINDEATNQFLHSLRGNTRHMWLGMEYNETVGDHVWTEDQTTLTSTYTNWNDEKYRSNPQYSCGYMHADQQWRGISCDASNFYAVICKNRPQETSDPTCEDSLTYCDEILEDFAGSCIDNLDFAKHNCRESCGYCTKQNTPAGSCSHDESAIVHAHMVDGATNIDIGQAYKYECDTGYSLASGSLIRACKKDSTLTGSPPVCQDSSTVKTPNNNLPIRRRQFIFTPGFTFVAKSMPSRMHKDGNIVAWKFHSVFKGVAVFQIFRFISGNQFQLIGQNVVTAYDDRKHNVEISLADQITVKTGDLIGIYLPTVDPAGISYEKCDDTYVAGAYGQWFKDSTSKASYTQFSVGATYSMNEQTGAPYKCKIIPVTALVQ